MLATLTHCRRVDDRQQFLDMLNEDREEQGLVGILQIAQKGIALKVGVKAAQDLQTARRLLIERPDIRRQQPVQLEDVALGLGERRALVVQRVGEQLMTGERGRQMLVSGVRRDRGHRTLYLNPDRLRSGQPPRAAAGEAGPVRAATVPPWSGTR